MSATDGARTWTITDLAAEYDVTLRTIRHYEDIGLLAPGRRGTVRVYRTRDRIRLQLILRGKRLGFSLREIATIVDMYDEPPGEAGQLNYLLDQIAGRRAELEQRRRDIRDTLTELARVEQRCREELATLGLRVDQQPGRHGGHGADVALSHGVCYHGLGSGCGPSVSGSP